METKSQKTVLVVDDDKSSRALLKDILEAEGVRVIEAEDGEEAWEFLSKGPVDLLIVDRVMPRLGGLELLARAQKAGMAIPSLMISGYGEEQLWGQAIGAGARDYLLKPFSTNDVLKVVRKCLGGRT